MPGRKQGNIQYQNLDLKLHMIARFEFLALQWQCGDLHSVAGEHNSTDWPGIQHFLHGLLLHKGEYYYIADLRIIQCLIRTRWGWMVGIMNVGVLNVPRWKYLPWVDIKFEPLKSQYKKQTVIIMMIMFQFITSDVLDIMKWMRITTRFSSSLLLTSSGSCWSFTPLSTTSPSRHLLSPYIWTVPG